jgi:hypothetical protein
MKMLIMRATEDKITLMNRGMAENKRSVTQALSFRMQTHAFYALRRQICLQQAAAMVI